VAPLPWGERMKVRGRVVTQGLYARNSFGRVVVPLPWGERMKVRGKVVAQGLHARNQ